MEGQGSGERTPPRLRIPASRRTTAFDKTPNDTRATGMLPLFAFALFSLVQCRLRGCEAGDRHAKRRAAHIVKSDRMAEFDTFWLASMFAAYSQFDVLTGLPGAITSNLHELADTVLVDRRKRIRRDDLVFKVGRQEAP